MSLMRWFTGDGAVVKPTSIRLEASSACQLRCPSCPTTTGAANAVVGTGHLKFVDFKKLVDDNPQIKLIELSNYGEILLNPQLKSILAYAQRKGVACMALNGVNMNTAKPDLLESLVLHELREISVSIDGASQETYEKYRVRGDFDVVMGNVRKLVEFKEKYGAQYPILRWQFVVFGHNQHELPVARKMAEDLGMVFVPKLSWDEDISPVVDNEQLKLDMGVEYTSRSQQFAATGEDYMNGNCLQLWNLPQINWDGKMLGCCRNYWGDFGGNAFRDGLTAAVTSEKMTYARQMLMGQKPARDDIPCTTCDLYTQRVQTKTFVDPQRVRMDDLKRRAVHSPLWHRVRDNPLGSAIRSLKSLLDL